MGNHERVMGLLAKAKAEQEEYEWREVLKIWEESGCSFWEISDDVLAIWGREQWNKWFAWVEKHVPATTVADRNIRAIHYELRKPMVFSSGYTV